VNLTLHPATFSKEPSSVDKKSTTVACAKNPPKR
jgi:hypothetical protein